MNAEQEAQLREKAREVAAQAPPLSDENRHRLAHLLRPALTTITTRPGLERAA